MEEQETMTAVDIAGIALARELERLESGQLNGGDARNVYQRPTRTKGQTKEMNNMLEGINSRLTEVGKEINDLEDRMVEITATEYNIEKRM